MNHNERVLNLLNVTAETAYDKFRDVLDKNPEFRSYVAAVLAKTIVDSAFLERLRPENQAELTNAICVRAMTALTMRLNAILNPEGDNHAQ